MEIKNYTNIDPSLIKAVMIKKQITKKKKKGLILTKRNLKRL